MIQPKSKKEIEYKQINNEVNLIFRFLTSLFTKNTINIAGNNISNNWQYCEKRTRNTLPLNEENKENKKNKHKQANIEGIHTGIKNNTIIFFQRFFIKKV